MLLALETALDQCSVALMGNGRILSEREDNRPREQTRLILPMIESVLTEARVEWRDLQVIAFSRGPGSFSGIRINTAVAQALAYAHELQVVPVSTLQVIAQASVYAQPLEMASRVMAVIDARMSELFVGAFVPDADGLMQPVGSEQLLAYDRVLPPSDWTTAVRRVGAGSALVQGWTGPLDESVSPSATAVAELAWPLWRAGRAIAPHEALPVYLRDDAWVRQPIVAN